MVVERSSKHPGSAHAKAISGKSKPATGKRVGKSKSAKANNQLNRRVK